MGCRRRVMKGLVCSLAAGAMLAGSAIAAVELPKGFRLEPVLSGLTEPTALAETPEGTLLIAERGGTLRAVYQGVLATDPVCTVAVTTTGDAGLLGVAVHPQFVSNRWIYLYYTDSASGRNKVTRYRLEGGGCTGATDILSDLGAGASLLRNGGGITFGSDGELYVATGDMENGAAARDDASLAGKILRVNDDGTIPADNPDPTSLVFAKGVRDGRGLAVSAAGEVYASDAGATSDARQDELNQVPAGGDLGWNAATGDSGGVYDDPLVSWDPPIGVAGLAVFAAGAFPDAASDGEDSDGDRLGPDEYPGARRVDDNAEGTCVGSDNNGLPCTSDSDCPPRIDVTFGLFNENSFCEFRDEMAEYCPGGTPAGDDACGGTGAAGVDEPDESYDGNLFMAAGPDTGIVRAVLDPADPTALSTWATFFDASALPDCPTGWRAVMAGSDGFLYAVADNGGGNSGALYRVVYDAEIGPREVAAGSLFPVSVKKGTTDTEVVLRWEDLRDDARQPRDNGTDPLRPEREYTVWMGTLGNFYSHDPVSGLEGVPGQPVNDALREATFDAGTGNKYFLVSARSANLEGTLGQATDGTVRPGPAVTDLCETIGYHGAPDYNLWTCGQDFTLKDELGETHSLYEYRGHVVMLDLSAWWCGPCQAEADVLENLNQDYRDREVQVLTLLVDEESNGPDWYGRPCPAECRNWSDRDDPNPDHTFPCWVDELNPDKSRTAWPLYNKYGAFPTNVILDTGLRVVYSLAGYDEPGIRSTLDKLVGATDTCLH